MSAYISAILPHSVDSKKFVGTPLLDRRDGYNDSPPKVIGHVTEVIGNYYNGVIYDENLLPELIKDKESGFSIEVKKEDLIL